PPSPPLSDLPHRAPAALRPPDTPRAARALRLRARRGARAREQVPARVLAAAGACAGRARANARPARVAAAGRAGGGPMGRRLPASRQRVDDEPADAMRLVALAPWRRWRPGPGAGGPLRSARTPAACA